MKNFLDHPNGFFLLCFLELWERFGFYTVQAILILYMSKGLHMNDVQANAQYALFAALLFITPVIGGYMADRYLGFQRAIVYGGLLFIFGFLLCALPGVHAFYLGLTFIVFANGLYKPNASALLGRLYQANDARRDGAFTLFYMGGNIGALAPPLIAGLLVARYGWHSGFLLAALGMSLGQFAFMLGKGRLNGKGLEAKNPVLAQGLNLRFYLIFSGLLLLSMGLCFVLLHFPKVVNIAMIVAAVGILLSVLSSVMGKDKHERNKIFACLILIVISMAFWSLYNQTFTSMTLFADRHMVQHFLGMHFSAESSQFFNPFYIVVLSPILSRLWLRLDKHNLNPAVQTKFFLGMFFMALGVLLLANLSHFFPGQVRVPAWFLGCGYLFQTIGELLISPIGLAMITVLCPKDIVGKMMGVWFFSQAAAFTAGGYLASLAAVPEHASPQTSLAIYQHAFLTFAVIGLVVSLISFLLLPFLRRLTAGRSKKLSMPPATL